MLDQFELMRGQKHRNASPGLFAQDSGHHVGGDRVESGERLVEDQQVGAVHERRGELTPLLVAVRERLHARLSAVAEPEPRQPRSGDRACALVSRAVQDREVLELIGDTHLRVEPAFFRHVADPLTDPAVDRPALPAHDSAVGAQQPADDPHRGCLAGPVAADESDEPPRGHREAQVV